MGALALLLIQNLHEFGMIHDGLDLFFRFDVLLFRENTFIVHQCREEVFAEFVFAGC